MNIFQYLPPELVKIILMELNFKDLKMLQNIKLINVFMTYHNIFNERKLKGFPREDGNCTWHDIQISVFNENVLNLITDKLYESDVVRGDIIGIRNNHHQLFPYIYDGYKISIMEKKNKNDGIVPSEYLITVPINYWINSIRYQTIKL